MVRHNLQARPRAYERVRTAVLEMIKTQKLRPGDRLPSEKELAQTFGLNHQTVRRGLTDLVEQNIIQRRVGSGTYVCIGTDDVKRLLLPQGVDSSQPLTIGLLVLAQRDAFAMELLNYLHIETEARKCQTITRTINNVGSDAHQAIQQLAAQGCRVILVPWSRHAPSQLWRISHESPIPLIAPGMDELELGCDSEPGWRDRLRIELAGRYLMAVGYGHLAFLAPDTLANQTIQRRLFAYARLVTHQQIGSHIRLIGPDANSIHDALSFWTPLMGNVAVICYDDECALRLITAAHKRNLRIPEDLAILGFNNIPMGQVADPPLTTIEFNYRRLAASLLDQAMALVQGQPIQPDMNFHERLIVRGSCGGRARLANHLDAIVEQVSQEVISSIPNPTSEKPKPQSVT